MSNSIVTDCPHCGAVEIAFTVRGSYAMHAKQHHRVVLASCNSCDLPIAAQLSHGSGGVWAVDHQQGDLFRHKSLTVIDIWPAANEIEAPEDVPEKVARNYVEAAKARQSRSWNAACGTYRRTMELALKQFAPDVEAWKLEKRIDKLAAANRITPDIQAWAHELRLDGNDALHGDEDATEEMTDQMHHLTHFLLVYLYSLPQQITTARERRAGS